MGLGRGVRIRYFLLSFAGAFFVWSILYLFLVNVVHPRTTPTFDAAPVSREEPYEASPGECITVLFMGTQGLESPPGAYLLARFDPVNGRVALCALPAAMQVMNNGNPESLTEVYAYGGAGYTRERLAAALGIGIDRYVRLTPESFISCAGIIGSVEFLLPATLEVVQDGAALELKQGAQLLDGRKALQILQYKYKTGAQSLDTLASLTAEIIEQRRDVVLSTLIDSVFERVINRVDSDISYPDYMDRKPAGEYFARLEGPVTKTVRFSGREENGREVPLDTFIAELAQYFG